MRAMYVSGDTFLLFESVTNGVPLEPPSHFRTFSLEASALSRDMSREQQTRTNPPEEVITNSLGGKKNTSCSPYGNCTIIEGAITNGTMFVAPYDPNAPGPKWRKHMEMATICVCNSLTCKNPCCEVLSRFLQQLLMAIYSNCYRC
jgi:hypothetical protein